MKLEFAHNPAYVSFERKLQELHELIATGEGDGEKADALRDAMASEYRSLSAKEVERLNGLSEDLYRLTAAPSEGSAELTGQDVETNRHLKNAHLRGDWEAVLPLLRSIAHLLPASDTAFQFYRAYAGLGHPETAYLFLHRASHLDPANSRKRYVLLAFAREAGRADEALAEAERLLREPATDVQLVIIAAKIRIDFLRNAAPEVALSALRELASVLESAMAKPDALKGIVISMAILGYTNLGFCFEALDDLPKAMEAFDQALKLDPQSGTLRVARGVVLQRHDPVKALTEFAAAAQLGTILFQPYLFLAHDALVNERWAEARDYALHLHARTHDLTVMAEAQHWLAIALFQLGAKWKEVEAHFKEAQRLDPFNSGITENFKRCQLARTVDAAHRSSIHWVPSEPNEFPQQMGFLARDIRMAGAEFCFN